MRDNRNFGHHQGLFQRLGNIQRPRPEHYENLQAWQVKFYTLPDAKDESDEITGFYFRLWSLKESRSK